MILTFTRTLAIIALFSVLAPGKASAQQIDKALNNPVIMKYYSAGQLQQIAAADTNELNSIVYYFTASFRVEPLACFECLPFDSAQFDIMRFEHLRQRDSVYTRAFDKYGFTLTLYPVSALPYTYAIHSIPQLDPGDKPKQQQR